MCDRVTRVRPSPIVDDIDAGLKCGMTGVESQSNDRIARANSCLQVAAALLKRGVEAFAIGIAQAIELGGAIALLV